FLFFFSSRRRHTRSKRDWSSDVCSSDLAAKYYKRAVLELGGNDPAVVLDSKDVPALAKKLVGLRLANAGQVCTSPKRFIVVDDLYDEFLSETIKAVEAT